MNNKETMNAPAAGIVAKKKATVKTKGSNKIIGNQLVFAASLAGRQ